MQDLRFIFLGTGTSAGIPAIGCRCDVCTSDDPRDTRLRTGAAVCWTDDGGRPRVVLLDATPDLRQQALTHQLARCDAVLFTHNHVDHIFGLDEVRRFNAVMRAPIDVYADRHTMEALVRVYQHIFNKNANINDSFVATLIPHQMEPGVPIDIHGLRFTPIRVLHGKLPILGFRIEAAPRSRAGGSPPLPPGGGGGPRSEAGAGDPAEADAPHAVLPLAYCTDTSGIPPETWPHLEGLETLVLDALRIRHHPTHYNLDQAVHVADRVGARRTWFVHMAHEILHAAVEPRLPEGVALAYDGLVLGDDAAVAPPEDAFAHDAAKDDDDDDGG